MDCNDKTCKSTLKSVKGLVLDILHRKNEDSIGKPYVLILGAGASVSSGVKSWWEMCRENCEEEGIIVVNEDYISAYKEFLDTESRNKANIYNRFVRSLPSAHPSLGYMHLAQLIKAGIFKTVITTNFDNLLEKVLYQMIPADQIKVFVRGEVPDITIAEYLNLEIPSTVTIIKIHGDLRSNVFFVQDRDTHMLDECLRDAITRKTNFGSIVVGSSLNDCDLKTLICRDSPNYFINTGDIVSDIPALLGWKTKQDLNTKFFKERFDGFMTRLNRSVQRGLIREHLHKNSEDIEKKILEDFQIGKGSNYFKIVDITHDVPRFLNVIRRHYQGETPDIIAVVHDPKAPGGLELYRHLRRDKFFKSNYDRHVEIVDICQGKTRYDSRRAGDIPIRKKEKNVTEILIIDVITFTGNTLRMVADKYRNLYKNATITAAVMYKSIHLDGKEHNIVASDINTPQDNKKESGFDSLLNFKVVSRPEVIFPWGITQATDKFTKRYSQLSTPIDKEMPVYEMSIEKRNWGSIEAFATQKNCSVRILTIEPWQELSFQRHIGRDEFFVSLDDNIGLEISAHELSEFQKRNDCKWHDITNVQSIVLEKGDCFLIPKGVWHRTRAFHNRVRLMEISYGIYDEKHDIERIYDMYNTSDRPRNLIPD